MTHDTHTAAAPDEINETHDAVETGTAHEGRATRHVVEELLRRIAGGDPDQVAALFADRFDWRLAWPAEGHPAVPWIRPRTSRADVADHFRSLEAHHVPEANGTSVARVLVDGADAVVLGEIAQTVRAGGAAYTSPFALHLTVENGFITRYHIYEDSLTVARALGSGNAGNAGNAVDAGDAEAATAGSL
ncbi:nuclear transport factor 2 family protein [Sphaerisporangium dianthi]|uniref:Nuclear transport factor 2 family protein n=1 Tax=Sphaerisporangium dianthi TaxID=1436120 RepID=A0ABV9C9E5_9ACTN